MQQTRKIELLVGFFVLAGAAALLMLLLKVADVRSVAVVSTTLLMHSSIISAA